MEYSQRLHEKKVRSVLLNCSTGVTLADACTEAHTHTQAHNCVHVRAHTHTHSRSLNEQLTCYQNLKATDTGRLCRNAVGSSAAVLARKHSSKVHKVQLPCCDRGVCELNAWHLTTALTEGVGSVWSYDGIFMEPINCKWWPYCMSAGQRCTASVTYFQRHPGTYWRLNGKLCV